jgi:pimeloyl-ACP methyl ester carboxylesterase
VLAWGPIRYARNGDVSIAYRVGGEKPVDLLFISGFVSHLEIGVELALAQRFFERLGSFARIIAFDKRGMGLSDRDAGAYTLENVVDDALAVLDAAGVERAVVFGVSEGGSAATMLAAAHPHRVSSMALYGAFARLARGPDYPEGIRPDVLEGFVTRMAEEWGQAAMLELWAPSLAGDAVAIDWWARWLRSGTSPGAMRALGLMYHELDVRAVLPSVAVPTLVLYRATTTSSARTTRASSHAGSPARRSSSWRVRTTSSSRATRTRCWMRSRSSSPGDPPRPSASGCSRPSSSPTSCARPSTPPSSAIAAGASSSPSTIASSSASWRATGAGT